MNWVSVGYGNGLSPIRRQAITWTNAGLLSIGPLGTNLNEIRHTKLLIYEDAFENVACQIGSHFVQGEMGLTRATGYEIEMIIKPTQTMLMRKIEEDIAKIARKTKQTWFGSILIFTITVCSCTSIPHEIDIICFCSLRGVSVELQKGTATLVW